MRPSPIIIPGPMGMGGSAQSSEVEIDLLGSLTKLLALHKALTEPQKNIESAKAVSGLFPNLFSPQARSEEELAGQGQGAFAPGSTKPAQLDINALASSTFGQDLLQKMVADKFAPLTLDKLAAARLMQGDLTGASEAANLKNKAPGAPSDYKTFYAAKQAEGMTQEQISQAWFERQKELQSNRIPGLTQGPSPDYAFDRRTGKWINTTTGEQATGAEVKESAGNYKWYSAPNTQRLIRRTESIVAPNGAADESIRFAKLVDNPAGTPINKLTGKAKTLFGQSQRALLDLVNSVSAEEQQQIFGAMGGGERFLELAQSLNNPDLSVEQYVNNIKELKWLIYTRQVANVRGTPQEKKWADMESQFKDARPFAEPEKPAGGKKDFGKMKTEDLWKEIGIGQP